MATYTSVAAFYVAYIVSRGLTFVFFKMEVGAGSGRKKKTVASKDAPLVPAGIAIPHVSQRFGGRASLRQYFTTIRVETGAILKSLPFIVIMLLAVLNTVGGAVFAGPIFGTRFYPVTYEMLEVIEGSFFFFAVIIAAFYAGEIVWRERMLKLNEVTDTMPSPTWAIWAGKLTALCITLYFTLFAAVLTTIAVQATKHYHHFELGLYFRGAFLILGMKLLLVTILMFLGQIITNSAHSPKHSAHGPKHSAHGPKHSAHGPKHSAHSPKHSAHSPKHGAHGPKHSARSPKHSAHSPKHGVHSPKHSARSLKHSARSPKHAARSTETHGAHAENTVHTRRNALRDRLKQCAHNSASRLIRLERIASRSKAKRAAKRRTPGT